MNHSYETSMFHQDLLGELVEIEHGFAFKGNFIHDEPRGDILLTPGNFAVGGGFKSDKFKYYDGPVPDQFVLGEGDLLVTMTDLSKQSDTLGYPALVPGLSTRASVSPQPTSGQNHAQTSYESWT